jgi:hypothetical protein
MPSKRPIRRLAAGGVALVSALAIAAPAAQAETSPFLFAPLLSYAQGPTVIGDAFNGGTTVCVSTAASACSTNAAP